MTDQHAHRCPDCTFKQCDDCASLERAFRRGQIAALRSVVVGLSFEVDSWSEVARSFEDSGRFESNAHGRLRESEWMRWMAIGRLFELGCPDARRIVGGEP